MQTKYVIQTKQNLLMWVNWNIDIFNDMMANFFHIILFEKELAHKNDTLPR